MKSLVELKYNEPTVSTRRVAEEFEQKHTYLMELLETHKSKLEVFGVVRFETYKPKTGRPQKIAELTEPQILLLLTYTRSRKRTDELRIKLISDFMLMKDFILKKSVARQVGIESRKGLTEVIKESGEQDRMHNHGFSNYTKMAYSLTGLTDKFKEYKKEFPKGKDFRSQLTPLELKSVDIVENMAKSLIESGRQYKEIKATLEPLFSTKELK